MREWIEAEGVRVAEVIRNIERRLLADIMNADPPDEEE